MIQGSNTGSALEAIQTERAGLDALLAALEGDLSVPFDMAVDAIDRAPGRVIVTGMGKSGHIAHKITATLASTGTPAYFVHPAEASHGDMGMIQAGDVIIAMSWSGETTELAPILAYSRRFKVPLIGISSNAASTLATTSDIALTLPKTKEACPHGLAPTTSSTMMLVLGDALAIALLNKRGFTAQDFKTFHPGGKLGAQLKTASEIMHVGDSLPLSRLDKPLADGLIIMTAKSFGCLGLVDERDSLVGIITDGDLRRNLSGNVIHQPMAELMTPNPKTIYPTMLLAEVLEFFNSNSITSAFVSEDDRVVGIVHIHDLLRLGVS